MYSVEEESFFRIFGSFLDFNEFLETLCSLRLAALLQLEVLEVVINSDTLLDHMLAILDTLLVD